MTRTVTTREASEERTLGRGANAALWAVQAVTAAAFLVAGISTLTGAEQAVAVFDAIGLGDWFRYLTGVLEVAGAVGVVIPRLSGLAGSALVGLALVAIAMHVFVIGGSPVPMVIFLILAAVVAWGRRGATVELWHLLAAR